MEIIRRRTKAFLSFVLLLSIIISGQRVVGAEQEYTSDLASDPTKASASSSVSGRVASRAFDNLNNNYMQNAWQAAKPTGWLKYDFGEGREKQIEQYTLAEASYNAPQDWTFEGSNDDVNWEVLHSVTTAPAWTNGNYEKRTYQFSNEESFRYYRINITKIYQHSPYAIIGEMEMMERYNGVDIPSSPTNLSGSASSEKVTLTWEPVDGADTYTIKRSSTQGGPYNEIGTGVTETTYVDNSLTNETTYYYIVTAVNRLGESSPSNEVSLTPEASETIPESPLHLVGVSGSNEVSLNWDSVENADSYTVKRATTPGGPYTDVATEVTSSSYTDTTVTNGTTYYYVVTAVNAIGESQQSNEVSVTPEEAVTAPSAPTLSGTPGNNVANLSWNTVANADKYVVKRSTTAGGPFVDIDTNVTDSAYIDNNVTNGTSYYYVVVAVNAKGESAPSNEVSVTPEEAVTAPLSPTLSGTPGNNVVNLSWNPVANADRYVVKRSTTASGPFIDIDTNVTDSDYSDNNVTNGTTYYYVVVAVNAIGESSPSNEVSATPENVITAPTAPVLTGSAGDQTVHLSWNSIPDVQFIVQRSTTPDGPFTEIANNVTGTSFTDTTVNNGTTYYYYVIAFNANGDVTPSNRVSLTPKAPSASGDRGILRITMTNGVQREYDLPKAEIEDFTAWINDRLNGTGKPFYTFTLTTNLGSYVKKTENVIYNQITSFDISEYVAQ